MALAISVSTVDKIQRDFIVRGSIVASGNYPTGGDALNFTTATYPLGVDGIKSSSGPSALRIWSQKTSAQAPNTVEYQYSPIVGLTQANSALQVITGSAAQSPGAELAAGAYPAGVSGDNIYFEAWFPAV